MCVKNSSSYLYIGAGIDTQPLLHFPLAQVFICIDSQPFSDYGRGSVFDAEMYRYNFVEQLIYAYAQIGYILSSRKIIYLCKNHQAIQPELFIFWNKETSQCVKYYTSTDIVYDVNPELIADIQQTTALIVSRYFPHKILLDYIQPHIDFYGYDNTVWAYITSDNSSVSELSSTMKMFENPHISNKYIHKWFMVCDESGEIIERTSYVDFLTLTAF
jgi:hypothetical protein